MPLPQQIIPADTTRSAEAVYDTVWAGADASAQTSGTIEQFMLSSDKLYTVLVVVLLIWFGLLFFVFWTDRRLARLERTLEERIPRD